MVQFWLSLRLLRWIPDECFLLIFPNVSDIDDVSLIVQVDAGKVAFVAIFHSVFIHNCNCSRLIIESAKVT